MDLGPSAVSAVKMYVPHLLQYSAAFCFLLVVFWLPGYMMERAALRGSHLGELRTLARICLGLGIWIGLVFLLSILGQFHSVSLWSAIGILTVAAAWMRLRFGIRNGDQQTRSVVTLSGLLCAGVLCVLVAPFFLSAMNPSVSWDADTYHLTLPRLFLANKGFRFVPLNVYSNWPLNTELLFAMAMLVKDYILAKLVHFGFGLLTLYAIYVGCRVFHRRASGWLAMVLFLANGTVAFELDIAYVDLAFAFFFLAAFLFMLWAVGESADRKPFLLLSGVCCGILAGIKVTGMVGAVAIAAVYLVRLPIRRRGELLTELRMMLAYFAFPAVVLWLPWLVKAAWYTGNPVYPFLYEWFGGPDWSSTVAAQFTAWQSSIGMGRAPLDYLLLPLRVILQGDRGYAHFDGEIGAFWIAMIPLALFFGLWDRMVRRCLGVAGLYFVFWSLSSQQMRLLIPVLPLLSIASAVTVVDLLDRIPSLRIRRAALGLCFAAAAVALAWGNAGEFTAGLRTLRLYSTFGGRGEALKQTAVHPVYRFVNDTLPEGARLLCLNTNHGFFLERDYLADSFFEASQIADWLRPASTKAGLRQRLADRGITHLLVAAHNWGISYPPALVELLRDRHQVKLLFRSKDRRFAVFELS